MKKPMSKRPGSESANERRSALPGTIPKYLTGFALITRYQIKARDGMQYIKILARCRETEKSAASPPFTGLTCPDRKITAYRIMVSIYTVIFICIILEIEG